MNARCWLLVVAWHTVLVLPPSIALAETKQQVEAREKMVREEIAAAGVKNPRVLQSVRTTQRHEFIQDTKLKANAYLDMALPIGDDQTISPPFVVSYMTEALDPQPDDVVLEIGTGSGYQAAILSPLVKEVYTIEIKEKLGKTAKKTLQRLKYDNVHCKIGDGFLGWPEHAPFDKIIVTCSPEDVPKPLIEQLKEGGRMVIPLGERYAQSLYLFQKKEGELVKEALLPTMFVPMTGSAEENRQIKPDPAHPQLVNGSFEEPGPEPDRPAVWYYQRQSKLINTKDAKEEKDKARNGDCYLTFTNATPGLDARALQAFPIDGRKVRKLTVSAWTKGKNVKRGPRPDDLPAVVIAYYDQHRKNLDKLSVLTFGQGTYDWENREMTFDIPLEAREAILRVGLLGAMGEISFDDVQVNAAR